MVRVLTDLLLEEVKPFLKTWSLRNTWSYKSNGRLLEEVDTFFVTKVLITT